MPDPQPASAPAPESLSPLSPGDRAATEILSTLRAWSPASADQDALRKEYLAFVETGGAPALAREGGPEHLTGSCFVFTPDLAHVLLCFHRKGQFWVQVGGHIEPGDDSVVLGALREAREESGIATLTSADARPFDLHRHELSARFGTCRVHWDTGYVAFAAPGSIPVTSDESEDVAWFEVSDLPDQTPPDFPERLATVLAELAHRLPTGH